MAADKRPATGTRGLSAFAASARVGDVLWLEIEDGRPPQGMQSAVKAAQARFKRYLTTRLFVATHMDQGSPAVTAVRLLRVTAGGPLE